MSGGTTISLANAYTFNKIAVAYQNENAKIFAKRRFRGNYNGNNNANWLKPIRG